MIDDLPRWALALIVGGLGLLAHWPSIDGRFLDWDDSLLVRHNAPLERLAAREHGGPMLEKLEKHGLGGHVLDRKIDEDFRNVFDYGIDRADYGFEYLPVRDLAYRFETWAFGFSARAFHATNLMLHAIGSVLAFLVLWELTGGARWAAFLGAAIYATHPVSSEAVDCIAHLKGVLMAAFFLAAWWVWLRNDGLLRYLAIPLYVFAVFSKTPAIVLPGVLLVSDYALRRRFDVRRWLAYAALGGVAIADFLIAGHVAKYALQQTGPHGGSFFSNALSAGAAFFEGFKLLLFPIGLEASRVNEALTRVSPDLVSTLGLLLVLGLVALGAYRIRERPLWGLALLLIPVIQLPYLQIRPFWVLFAERYWILAVLPFGLVVGRLLAGTPRRRALGLAVVVMFVAGSYVRAKDWSDTETLFADAAQKDDRNYIAHDKVGRERARAGDYDAAIASFRRSLEMLDRFRPLGQLQLREIESNTLMGLANSLVQAGRFRDIAPYVERMRDGWPDDKRVQAYVAFLDGLAAQAEFDEVNHRLERDRLVYAARIPRLSDLFAESDRKYREALDLCQPFLDDERFGEVYRTSRKNLAILYHDFAIVHAFARMPARALFLLRTARGMDPENQEIDARGREMFGASWDQPGR